MKREIPREMIDDARRIYLKYGGRRVQQIEREMRELGWNFHRQMLYNTRHSHGITQGWPERYGWLDKLTDEQRSRVLVRRRSPRKFEHWLPQTFPEYTWTWKYQRYVYKRLAEVTAGGCKRLMIFMPPRHGKSELITIRYTAWRLLQNPQLNVILGSYNPRLADKFSRRVKRIVTSDEGQRVTRDEGQRIVTRDEGRGTSGGRKDSSLVTRHSSLMAKGPSLVTGHSSLMAKDSSLVTRHSSLKRQNAVSEWETPGGGVVRSVGVGGGIAGFGAGLIVIDDPVKNRAEAESENYRERVWDWFNDDIYTRIEPGAAIILIQTRWHEDDLAGRLIKEMADGGEQWKVVSLAALAESVPGTVVTGAFEDAEKSPVATAPGTDPGDPLGRKPGAALCPQRYDVAALERFRKKLGSYSFAALYQQQPVPAEGGRFKRAWFKNIVDKVPEDLRWKRGYDLAVSTKTSADYTASFRCAKDKAGNLYIADGFRKRIEYPDQRRYAIERMRAEPRTEHGIEAALHGKAFVQDLRRTSGVGHYAFRSVRVDGDKLTRALAWLNLAEEGKVILVRGPWIDEFVDEICRFPSAKHDDQVDAVSIAVAMLERMGGRAWGIS